MNSLNDWYKRLVVAIIVFGTAFLFVAMLSLFRENKGMLDLLRGNLGQESAPSEINNEIGLSPRDVPLLIKANAEIEKIYDKVSPSVVSITAEFGSSSGTKVLEQGSGVIVTEDGLLVTNYHVIAPKQIEPDRFQVELIDGSIYDAKLVATDAVIDLALLRILGKEKFKPIAFGDSDKVKVGHRVFAFGNPYQLGVSLSEGNVAATNRYLNEIQHDFFQITAPVNPGQSGGPLVNIQGELVGINSAIFSKDKQFPGFQGIAFSIRGNEVKDSIAAMRDGRRPVWGYLGVGLEELNERRRSDLKYLKKTGALVASVVPDSPAYKAGLQPQDIIIKFAGKAVVAGHHLMSMLKRSANKEVGMTVWRDGKEEKLSVSVMDRSQAKAMPTAKLKDAQLEALFNKIGIVPVELSNEELSKGFSGVKVARVLDDSLAEEHNLMAGDYITGINGVELINREMFIITLRQSILQRRTLLTVERPGYRPVEVFFPQLRLADSPQN